jgi:hypothetical protein
VSIDKLTHVQWLAVRACVAKRHDRRSKATTQKITENSEPKKKLPPNTYVLFFEGSTTQAQTVTFGSIITGADYMRSTNNYKKRNVNGTLFVFESFAMIKGVTYNT